MARLIPITTVARKLMPTSVKVAPICLHQWCCRAMAGLKSAWKILTGEGSIKTFILKSTTKSCQRPRKAIVYNSQGRIFFDPGA
ncbi:MAG: hypothetical protein LBC62_06970 [Treponema sp.]|nr:hypothetical protein [Treponema sp.]